MSILVVGLNHRTSPIALLERLTIADEDLPKALHQLCNSEHVLEGALLSTCNRIEVYAVASKFHAGSLDLRNFLSEFCHVAPEEFSDRIYTYHDDAAVRHLFRVAAGIDSMVIGESEILGQVRRAYQVASAEASIQRTLGNAFRRALRVGKRARSETSIGRDPVSVSSTAINLASRTVPSLDTRSVAIVGAGKTGQLAARALDEAGVKNVTLVNRSSRRADEVAAISDAVIRPWEDLGPVLAASDVVISCTGAQSPVIDSALVADAIEKRPARPLYVIDIAVPRDVSPDVAALDGVTLYDLDDIRDVAGAPVTHRQADVDRIEEIVEQELAHWMDSERSNELAPTVAELVARADEIRQAEFERWRARAKPTEAEANAVDALSRRLIAKLLHGPVKKAKKLPSSKQGYLYLSALRELFDLSDDDDLDVADD
ncbi:MAG: glutamyl-tRNA reductase [Actinomycetota bacterium]|nr:glutamyl-tRNA reductase [Actinomycetota bacterium]